MEVLGPRVVLMLATVLLSVQPAYSQRLIVVTGLDGQTIYINANAIGSIRAPHEFNKRHLAPGTKCVVVMASGDLVSTIDTCEAVRHRVDLAAELNHNE